MRRTERTFVEAERAAVKAEARSVPAETAAFTAWFESLPAAHSSTSEALLGVLAERSTPDQLRWFLAQEQARNARFAQLLALTQLNLPSGPKLELANDRWPEINHVAHSQLFARAPTLRDPTPQPAVWEALAVGNLMIALASARHYAYQSLGALSFAQLVTPQRASRIDAICARLHVSVSAESRPVRWSREALATLIASDPTLAPLIAEGALMRLSADRLADARCLAKLAHTPQRVAQFEYAEESASPAPAEPVLSAPQPALAVRPVQWREVSARHP